MLERFKQGPKNFDKCAVKVVAFNDFVYMKGDGGKAVISPNPAEESRTYAGSAAVLRCPQTENQNIGVSSQFTNHDSRLEALRSLRTIAGNLLCQTCPYSGMTRAQVAYEQAEFARAETERIQAIQARTLAIRELEAKTGIKNWDDYTESRANEI